MSVSVAAGSLSAARYLTIPKAAEYLSLTPCALYNRIARRTIPFVKRGGRVWFDRAALDRWMRQGAVDVTAPPVIDSYPARESAPERE